MRPLSPEDRVAEAQARTYSVIVPLAGAGMIAAATLGLALGEQLSLYLLGLLLPVGVIGLVLVVAGLMIGRRG